MKEMSMYLRRMMFLRDEFQKANKEPFTSRFFHYAYILDGLVLATERYEQLLEMIEKESCFDLKMLIGMRYQDFDYNGSWCAIGESDADMDRRDAEELFKYNNFSGVILNDTTLRRSLMKIYLEKKMCDKNMEMMTKAMFHLNEVKEWVDVFRDRIRSLVDYFRILLRRINRCFSIGVSDEYCEKLVDYLIVGYAEDDEEILSDWNAEENEYINGYFDDYNNNKKGYLGGVTKSDLLDRELWKFIGDFLDSDFLKHVMVGELDVTNRVRMMWDKVKNKREMEGKEEAFIRFNCLFDYKNDRFVLNRVKMARYILNFSAELNCVQIDKFIYICDIMDQIYEDVEELDGSEDGNVCNEDILNGFKEVVDVLERDGKIVSGIGKERVMKFFYKLIYDKDRKEVAILWKRFKGTATAEKWRGKVTVKPIIRMFGILVKMGWLRGIDLDYLGEWLRYGGIVKKGVESWRKDFEEGKKRVGRWTNSGTHCEQASKAVYDYIEAVADSVM